MIRLATLATVITVLTHGNAMAASAAAKENADPVSRDTLTAFTPAATSTARLFAAVFPDSHGQAIAFSRYAGQIVVVNFWASWCGPCVREMPALALLDEQYKGRGVNFIGVGADTPDHIARFLAGTPVSYPIAVAGIGSLDIARTMGDPLGVLPYTAVIDTQGKIRWQAVGPIDSHALSIALDSMVRDRAK